MVQTCLQIYVGNNPMLVKGTKKSTNNMSIRIISEISGLGRWVSCDEHLLLLQKVLVQISTHTGRSQPSLMHF